MGAKCKLLSAKADAIPTGSDSALAEPTKVPLPFQVEARVAAFSLAVIFAANKHKCGNYVGLK
jgi:hypothetical protein